MTPTMAGWAAAILLPLCLFAWYFRKSWADEALLTSTLIGLLVGGIAVLPVKYVAYPGIEWVLGIDLRRLIEESDRIFEQLAACVGIIGPIEEGGKVFLLLAALAWLGLHTRPTAIFLASLGCGVGFALVENLDYYRLFGLEVLAMRSLLGTSAHCVFSSLSGFGLSRAFSPDSRRGQPRYRNGYAWLLVGLFTASVVHGLFNVVAFRLSVRDSVLSLLVMVFAGLGFLYRFWIKMLKADRPGESEVWKCSECGLISEGKERFCPRCGERVCQATPTEA